MKKRRGKRKALIAIGHKIIVAAYFVIKNKEEYKAPQPKKSNPMQTVNYHFRQLKKLGFEVQGKHLVPTQ
ncbi:MAG: hypothetical protein AAGG59_18795 [Bacteroidota bacterium]